MPFTTTSFVELGRGGGFLFPETIRVSPEKRGRHMHAIGPTGSGKTTLLTNMVLQDIYNGHGLALIDPKGDMVGELLGHIPSSRFDDVILFDITDFERPLGFNALERLDGVSSSRVASDLVTTFKKLFGESWGPRLEHILRFSVLTLGHIPGSTLLDIPDLLMNKDYREAVLTRVNDRVLQNFWRVEYKAITKGREYIIAIEPILNKVGPWLAYPEIRNIVGQTDSSFNLREVMDNRKILLVRLPEAVGEDIAGMIGALLVSKIQLAAVSRASVPPGQRRPFYLYVDEFQNFFTSAFKKILTEARSYELALIIANQYDTQLSEGLQDAILYNVAVKTSFQKSEHKGKVEYLAYYSEPQNPAAQLEKQFIPRKPLQRGNSSVYDAVRQASREKYGRPRDWVEREINTRAARRSAPGRPQQGDGVPSQYD